MIEINDAARAADQEELPEMVMSKKDPLEKIAKSLQEIEHELHELNRNLSKRRS